MTSIRTKIFIPISIISLILIGLNLIYIYWVYLDLEDRKKIIASDNVSRLEQKMQDVMSHTRYLIDNISKDQTVIESIELGTQYTAYPTLNIIFKQENFDELIVYSNDGEIFHNSRVEENFGKSDALYPWLVSLINKKIIECASNSIDSYPALLCAKSIHSINGLVGFVVAGYFIDESFINLIEEKLNIKLKVSKSSNLNYDQNSNLISLKNSVIDRQIEPFNLEILHDFSKINEDFSFLGKYGFASITLSFLLILFSWLIFKKIANKILTLSEFAKKLKRRDFDYKIIKNKESSGDEIDQISSSFYDVANSYSDFSDICSSIANGNTKQKIKVQSESDNLGLAINKMVDSLRKLEKKNNDKINDIRTLNKQLELASKEKSTFVATMSHEIRTPLNAVLGMIETIKDDNLGASQMNQLEIARRSGNQLVQIIDDILDFSKIEVGKIDFTYSNIELRYLLEDLIGSFSYQANIKNNDLFYQVESNVPSFVYIDSTRIRQVLSNLLSNAIKFTENGEIFIRLSLLNQEEKSNQVSLLFEVHDNGPGIEVSIKNKLFEPFTHKDPISKTHRGSGLGLAISRRILELMGGKIWIDLNKKKGTCFNVEISSEVINDNQVGELSLLHPILKTKKGLIISEKDTLLGSALYQFLDELKMVTQIEKAQNVLNNKIKLKDIDVILLVLGNKSNQEERILLMLRDQYNFNQIPTIVFSSNSVKKNMNDDNKKYVFQNRQLLKNQLVKNLLIFFGDQTEMIDPKNISLNKSKINPIKVLVVDDNVINHYVVSKLLRKIGVKINSCYDGSEAISKIKKENFDIIFVDIHMPNMDGFTLSERVIDLMKHKKIPLMYAMTADVTKETRYKSIKAGMIDVIAKPLTLEKIKIIIDEFARTQKNDLLNTKTDLNYILLDEEFLDEYGLDILKDLLILFNKEAPKNIKLLSIDQTTINFSQISEIAHKFKGTALTIGALYLAELCGELQKVCQKKQSVEMSKKIAQIIKYYKKTNDLLKTYIDFREKLMGMAND